MDCKRFVRVLPVFALTASLSFATYFAKDVTLTFQGHEMTLTDVDGAYLSHELTHVVQQGSGVQLKQLGKPKYEDIKVSMRVGQFDPIMLDMMNSALKGHVGGNYALELDGPNGMKLDYSGIQARRIVTPGFDAQDESCTEWQLGFSFTSGTGYPGQYLMKAKEKANRTKCGNNLRLMVPQGGRPKTFVVNSSDPVETTLTEVDLDGDGKIDAMSVDVGNVVLSVPGTYFGFFEDWMKKCSANPVFGAEDLLFSIQTDRFGSMAFTYNAAQPISVVKMADGSVRVEFCVSGEQLQAKPRN